MQSDRKPMNPFKSYSTTHRVEEMKKDLKERVYVLGEIAILGQSTVIYAAPNTGKTLLTFWMLIEAIREGRIDPAQVTYVNADDDEKGVIEKSEIASEHGFSVVAPGLEEMTHEKVIEVIKDMIEQGTARDNIVIIDTYGSFVEPNNYREQRDFLAMVKTFTLNGGTLIVLAHTNKHKVQGRSVHGGTADLKNSASSAYVLEKIEGTGDGPHTVEFRNEKRRGSNSAKEVYRYIAGGKDYAALLDSVERLGEAERRKAIAIKITKENLQKNKEIIPAVVSLIERGVTGHTELFKEAAKESGESQTKVKKALEAHAGDRYEFGHRWQRKRVERKNGLEYTLTPEGNAYKNAKSPEF